MAKFRTKPVVIEAQQFFYGQKPWPPGVVDMLCYCEMLAQEGRICERCKPHGRRYGRLLVGNSGRDWVDIENGDYVIQLQGGGQMKASKASFEARYEAVDG